MSVTEIGPCRSVREIGRFVITSRRSDHGDRSGSLQRLRA
jgi:hypothetical protein